MTPPPLSTRPLRTIGQSLGLLPCFGLALGVGLAVPAWGAGGQEAMHVYTVQSGDTLIGLGERLLRNPLSWPELARINRMALPRRIPVGAQMQIPLRLLKSRTVSAKVTAATGQAILTAVQQRPTPVRVGDLFDFSEEIHTGQDGFVTVELADGSEIRIRPSTIVRLEHTEHFESAGFFKTKLKLLKGRVDSLVKRAGHSTPSLEIQTPQTIMGVRGTAFRTIAGLNDEAVSAAEVLSGTVMAGSYTPVSGGYGVRVNAAGTPTVDKLLPAPLLLPAAHAVQEKLLVRIPLAPVPGARAYRAHIARDASFNAIVADVVSVAPEFRLTNLPDGVYNLRVRAINAQGLEGMDTTSALVINAQPEPPVLMQPEAKAKLRSANVAFAWTQQPEAHTYHLQLIGADQPWAQPTVDRSGLIDSTWTTSLPVGQYQWRLASVRANGDQGPWSEPKSFVLRQPPQDVAPPVVTRSHLTFYWDGEAGQSFDFQFSDEPAFKAPTFNQHLTGPTAEVPKPEAGGRWYVRYRAIDADGFVGRFTRAQAIDLPSCMRDRDNQCVRSAAGLVVESR